VIDLYTWFTPNVRRWYLEILDRPATRRGWNVPENEQEIPMP
jgi:hypothetical protein